MATAHGSSPPHRPDIKPRESGEGGGEGGFLETAKSSEKTRAQPSTANCVIEGCFLL